MPLFQKSVLNKFIKSQDSAKIETAYQQFSDIFLNEKRQAEIRSMKEEEYQDGFLNDLFIKILGYVIRPNDGYNLVREKKNEADSKKADGAILKNDMPLAVIELKGTDTTDLDKVTNQGFGYKNNHKECVYVVISNFEKLRFFIHHAVDYIEFNLFTLTKEEFTTLWLCLHSENLLDNIPAKIKAESVVKEEDITKNLYKDYSTFKQELWQDIVRLNPNGDPLQFYKKSQKLIDRFLFIFFAEDAGLLPPNSISRMVDRWKTLKEEDAYKPLYEIFKQYFGYINTGRKGKTSQDDIFAYNGGLMAEDEVLETISISDDVLLKHVSRLTTYDFSSEVDVNILGHIFENSLNDIEAVTAELEGQEIDKSKTKRKKDGVFYTPKYITKYIVDNTVGKLCDEKKVELNIVDEEYAKGRTNRKKETLKQLDENLQAYRNWLLNITICDPACGSGAFLNQALEYLMEEHRYIDELESQLLGAGFTFPGVENHILENNIFGVDINEESIEIAKLSLWLRTAQRGRKLTSLNNNIKCGNSLIDDPEVAGDKAFSWEKEFPSVFEKGGFDVVIGNPPYVSNRNIKSEEKPFLNHKYSSAYDQYDLYVLFMELSQKLNKKNGYSSFILPDKFLISKYGEGILKFLSNRIKIIEYWDLTEKKVFADASVYPIIYVFKNINTYNHTITKEDFNSVEIHKKLDDSLSIIEKVERTKKCDFDVWRPLSTSTNLDKGSLFCVSNLEVNRYHLNYKAGLFSSSNYRESDIQKDKILIKKICYNIEACIDFVGVLPINTTYCIKSNSSNNLMYLLIILNSKLLSFYARKKFINTSLQGGYIELRVFQVKELPIKEISLSDQQPFIEKANKMLQLNKDLQERTQKFISLLQSDFQLEKPSKKIEEFYSLDWSDFNKELQKNKITLLGVSKDDWFDRFERFKKQALELKSQIDQTDKEIDRMVYELYGLTEEEIQIVENS